MAVVVSCALLFRDPWADSGGCNLVVRPHAIECVGALFLAQFLQFWPILDPLLIVRPLYSIKEVLLSGSESHKSLHKFLLPENAMIFDFSNVEMPFKCPKVEFGGKEEKYENFDLKLGIKF